MKASLIPVSGNEGTLAFEGLISQPSHSRASRRWQYLVLNGRPVRDARVNHAVYQAYRTLLMKGRHPAFFLRLRLDPAEVDVNVHPAKTEVRLRNPQFVHSVLARQLAQQLKEQSRQQIWSGTTPFSPASGNNGGETPFPAFSEKPQHPAFPFLESREVRDQMAARENAPDFQDGGNPSGDGGGVLSENPYSREGFHFQALTSPVPSGDTLPDELVGEDLVLLDQLHATYILAQKEGSLVLVDQHAAHERILFEQLRTQFYQGSPAGEPFLLPLTLELSAQNALLLEQYLPQWNQMGFDMEAFGRNSFLVRQVPALLKERDIEELVLEVLDELALFGKSGRLEEVINEIMERVACHGAIRAGMSLGREEMSALLAQMKGMDINMYCPHGRPVWVEISLHELEKRFKRIV